MENCENCIKKDEEITNLNERLSDLETHKDEITADLQEQLGEAVGLLNEIKKMAS